MGDDLEFQATDRRGFCRFAGSALVLAALARGPMAAAGAPQADESVKRVPDTKASLPPGSIKDYRKLGNFFLLADSRGVYALSSVCTHAGCSVRSVGTDLECPCHGSAFDRSGAVTAGPAKTPLQHFEVREATPGGTLMVDLGKQVTSDARL